MPAAGGADPDRLKPVPPTVPRAGDLKPALNSAEGVAPTTNARPRLLLERVALDPLDALQAGDLAAVGVDVPEQNVPEERAYVLLAKTHFGQVEGSLQIAVGERANVVGGGLVHSLGG